MPNFWKKIKSILKNREEYSILLKNNMTQKPKKKGADYENLYLLPGLIDVNIHLREPGFIYKK